MLKYIDYLCAILVRLVNIIFHITPIRITLWLSRRLGAVVLCVNKDRRIIAYANIRAAFASERSPRQIKKLVKATYENLLQVFVEILSLTKVDKKYIDKYIDIRNPENMLKIKEHPDGIILLTAHFGNWELSGVTSALKGFPLVVLAREQKMKRLNGLLDKLRESKGLKVVTKGITTRYIVKSLHEGKTIGMVGDQDAGKTGIFTNFLGRPASTASGSVRFAAGTGAYILPAFIARIKGPYHKLTLEEPIKVPENTKKDEDIRAYLEKYNHLLENQIRNYPTQYLWLHKRWKSTPLKKVIILDDGKPGHLNQSLSIAGKLRRYRLRNGNTLSDTEIKVIKIRFKNKTSKILFNIMSVFSGSRCQGCGKCLKFALTGESYNDLMTKYADVVISAGSAVSGVNRIFAIENNAKNAVVMKPSFLGASKFSMVVIPEHDRGLIKGKNVIVSEIVPNMIDKESMERSAERILPLTKNAGKPRIGVLLGGDNADFALTTEITESISRALIEASERIDAEILFTSSRRTPEAQLEMLKEKLVSSGRCKLFISANNNNITGAVPGILGLSDIVVVSGESASMVSEAVASNGKVCVFSLERKKQRSKFDRMISAMEEKGFIKLTDPERMADSVEELYQSAGQKARNFDEDFVYANMWRLF